MRIQFDTSVQHVRPRTTWTAPKIPNLVRPRSSRCQNVLLIQEEDVVVLSMGFGKARKEEATDAALASRWHV